MFLSGYELRLYNKSRDVTRTMRVFPILCPMTLIKDVMAPTVIFQLKAD